MFETIILIDVILIDGCKFTGTFKDKKRNGFGIKYYPNGATYEGIYVDDKRHGKGIKTKCIHL